MEHVASPVSPVPGSPTDVNSGCSAIDNNKNCDAVVFADMSGDNFDEMTLSCSESEGWVQPSSISYLANQGGALGPPYPPASGDFASLPSYSNISSNAPLWQQQGPGASVVAAPTQSAAAADDMREGLESPWVVLSALKREVFATAALLRALRVHAAAQTRGVTAMSQQQLAAAVAPLVRSFDLLSERLAAAEAAKEPPPTELQEQHIHPFLFVLAQQQLHHRQQQGLSKQQLVLQQSCMRALASAVLRSLDQLLIVGLSHCRSAAGRRCLHALILSLTNCALQAAQRLLTAATQPTATSAAATAAAAALASEAYGGSFFAPASPAAEEELLLLQCLDLLTSSLLGPAGHLFSDTCVARIVQCCVAVSLLTRASPLLRNAAASRAVSITRHLFASERLTVLSRQLQQQQQQQGEGAVQQQGEGSLQQDQHAASPPHFMARLGSALSLRSIESGCLPLRQPAAKRYGLEARQRVVALLAGLLAIEEPRGPGSTNTNGATTSNAGSRSGSLPPFVFPPEPGVSPTPSEGTPEQRDVSSKQGKSEEEVQAAPGAAGAATANASISVVRDTGRAGGLSGIDRDFECVLGHHVKDKASAIESRLFCLRLLCAALEAGKETICLFPSLLRPLQAQILPVVLKQDTRSAPLLLLSLTLRVLGDFLVFLRPYIKDEMERCLYQLLRLSISSPGGPPRTVLASEAQEIALDMLRELCSEEAFGFELLLNYDCDIRRSNVFGVLLALLTQLAAPRIPGLRGSYRLTDSELEGRQGQLSSNTRLSPQSRSAAQPATSDIAPAKSAQQQQSPSGTSLSPAGSNPFTENNKPHHHGAFHLRKAPQKTTLRASRSTTDTSAAATPSTAPETVATDAAGVARPAGLSTVNRLALAAILRLISALATRCDSLRRRDNGGQLQQQQVEKPQLETASAAEYFLRIQERLPLTQRRKNKVLLSLGAAAFNANAKDAASHLEGLGLVTTPTTPRSVALFLKETKGLDLRTVGLYLSANKPWNTQVLREFVGLFAFSGVGLVAALREFLRTFRLPGESQQIERVMEAFADEYFRQQPLVNCPHNDEKLAGASAAPASSEATAGGAEAAESVELSLWRWVVDEGFYCASRAASKVHSDGSDTEKEERKTGDALTKRLSEFTPEQPPHGYALLLHKDTVFVLSYSIIMLNTDQYNSQVRSRMRMEDFVKNNRGINNGSDLPPFFLQNIYLSIKHEEIKLKEMALPTASSPQSVPGQKTDAAAKEHLQQPDLFDILAEGWTPVEGAGFGWGAYASPYGGSGGEDASDAPIEFFRVRDSPTCSADDSTRSSSGDTTVVDGLEHEMFKSLWGSGCFSVLRGAFEASLDMRQLEEILCGCLSLARVATILGEVAALNTIVAELCSYFVYSVPAHSQLVLPPVMYLVRRSGAFLREEGWGAIIELLLRLHALDLLPPALMGLDDFEGSGGTALHSLCNVTPPPFVAPASRRDRGAPRKGGGWLGDLTSILFALGDSDDESDAEDASGMHGQLMAWPEEVNSATDGLYMLRASTDFALLPSTLALVQRSEVEPEVYSPYPPVSQAPQRSQGGAVAISDAAGTKQLPKGRQAEAQHDQQQQQHPQDESLVAPSSSSAAQEDEETATALGPYLRLKALLAQGVRVDLAVAELFRQVEPISSLSIAVVLLVHILLGFPSLRQNPGAPPGEVAKQQQQLASSAVASHDGTADVAGSGSSATVSTTASVISSSGAPTAVPPALQPPDELASSAFAAIEASMLSSYQVDMQRRGVDADSPRSSISNSSSAVSTPIGLQNASSAQGSNLLPVALPPPVWSPLRGGTIPPLLSYREFTDRLFCLEILGALMLSELTPGSLSLHPSDDYGTALVQKSPWILCAVYLDAFLRRYAIGSAAAGVPNPIEAVGLAEPLEQQQQSAAAAAGEPEKSGSCPPWACAMLNACSKDPLALATMRSVCSVFQAVGSRRLVETPASLPHWELLFIERLVVTILRICLRLLSDEDSLLLPVYTRRRASEQGSSESPGCAAACQVAIHLLQLLTLLHPNVFCMHVQRIAQSAIILVSRLNLKACSSPLLIQVLLALYQRLVPLPAFAPTSPLPQQLTQQQQQQQLARRVLVSLAEWIRDPEALTLLVLQHRNHYQMLLQTLMAFCIYTPPATQPLNSSVTSSCAEGEGKGREQRNQHQKKNEGLGGPSPYEANCTSLELLASLVASIGDALQSKAATVATRLAIAADGLAGAPNASSCYWRARLDCQAMWLQAMQVLAIVCSFAARPVKVKALAALQQALIRCSVKVNHDSSSTAPDDSNGSENAETSETDAATAVAASVAAAAAREYWGRAAEDPYTWQLCLQLVVFPLLSFRFDYPYCPPAPGDAPPPPPQQQQNGIYGGDSAYSFPTGLDGGLQQRDPHLTLPWMALPTRRRLTPEVAITTLGLDEVYQRKAAAASLACRLFLTKMEQLLQPFHAKGFCVDFSSHLVSTTGTSEPHGAPGVHPGGIEGLLPPLTQLVQLLVAEAKQAPLIYRDAFLESMKNTLLVVLTCPAVAATDIPSTLRERIAPVDVLQLLLSQQQQQGQQQKSVNKEEQEGAQKKSEEVDQIAAKREVLIAALACLTDSQRLVVSAVSSFIGVAFPGVMQDLLLILPTPQPPPPPRKLDPAGATEPAAENDGDGVSVEPAGTSPGGTAADADQGYVERSPGDPDGGVSAAEMEEAIAQ